jgi:CDGSH-type Zn-finger protein
MKAPLRKLRIQDMAEPKFVNAPIVVDETPGKKAYCQCGLSEKLPYCDGAHSRESTGLAPMVVEITEPSKKAVCQCNLSGNKPWCDGSHKNMDA